MPTRDQLNALKGKPELDAGSMRILRIFDDVSTERPAGMGLMSIPQSAVIAYGDRYGMSLADKNRLWQVIRLVDAAVCRKVNAPR
jgi:hypothetical protein